MTGRPLGGLQRHALEALARHNGGTWYPGAGWVWANTSTTVRLLESLVGRGLAVRTEKTGMAGTRPEQYPVFTITDKGRQEVR